MFKYYEDTNGVEKVYYGRLVRDVIVGLILIIILTGSFRIVGAGHRGVLLTLGAVSDESLGEGLHFKLPIIQSIKVLDVRTVKYEAEAAAYSKDIQTVDALLALNYHIDKDRANKVYQEIGTDYESRIINPAMQESLKAVSAKYTAQDLIEKREIVKEEVKSQLAERLSVRSIQVDELSIVNFDFSSEYEKAVEAKQVAQQSALKAENDLKRIKTEAEQRVAQAKAEAEAISLQSQAANNEKYVSLKALEVQLEAIKKWNGVLPQQFIPGSSLPFINLTK